MNLSTISNNIYYVCANLFLGLFAHREISNVHAKESPCEFKNIEPVQFDTLESIYSITSTLVIVWLTTQIFAVDTSNMIATNCTGKRILSVVNTIY